MIRNIGVGVLALLRRRRVEAELEEELEGYLEASAAAKLRAGMSAELARISARREMGSRAVVKHKIWGSRWEATVDGLLQDLRLSVRGLLKSPGFTLVALLSLALGIGANTAIFTLIEQVLLKSMPVEHPEQLVTFGKSVGGGILGGLDLGLADMFPWDFSRQVEANPGPFQGIASYQSFSSLVNVRRPNTDSTAPAEQVQGSLVSGNYFSVLGAQAVVGRTISLADDATPGSGAVVVVSFHYWQQALGSDRSVLGKTITVNGTPFQIIGVMGEGFYGIKREMEPPAMWMPVSMQAAVMQQPSFLTPRGAEFLHLFGRLSAEAAANPAARAQSQMWLDQTIHNAIRATEGTPIAAEREQEINRETVRLVDGSQGISAVRSQYGDSLGILMAVTGLVLLIACANLANFLLARAAARQREIATRLALGSSRGRIMRQSLIETLLLSLTGGVLGLGLAFVATRALIVFVAEGSSYTALSPVPDAGVLLFTLGVSLGTGLLFGLAPAVSSARMGGAASLSSSARTTQSSGGRGGRLWPKALVTAQVMLALLLLVGAGLFLRTLSNLQNQDYGFERTHLLMGDMSEKMGGYKPTQLAAFHQQLLERLKALPGVTGAALAETPPISYGAWSSSVKVAGYTPAPKEDVSSLLNRVSSDYFAVAGIEIVSGRGIGVQDSATSVKSAVVNEAFVRHFFPKGDPLGRTMTVDSETVKGPWQIVGVARDTKVRGARYDHAEPATYLPLTQIAPMFGDAAKGPLEENTDSYASTVLLRTAGDPAKSIADLRRTFQQIDPNLPLLHVVTIGEYLETFVAHEELVSRLTALFAGLAVLLAAIGLYGVMSYNVVRRTNEIGVRLALGAQARTILWMVLRESLMLLAVGLVLGLPLAFALTRLVREQLFGVTALDPVTFVSAVAVVAGMTLFAAWLPARVASRVDPMVALRCD